MKVRSALALVPAVLLAFAGVSVVAIAPRADAAVAEPFSFLAAPLTQELYAVGVFPPTGIAGGLAFAPNGDLLAGGCVVSGALYRFGGAPVSTHQSSVRGVTSLPSAIGCGLVNGPGGAVYSNTARGVVQVDPDSGHILAGPGGPGGNDLGVAYDPVGNRFIYAAPRGLAWVGADLSGGGTLSTSDQYDGVYVDPTGQFIFAADGVGLDIIDRNGALVQRVLYAPSPGHTDGVAFNTAGGYVVTNNTDGTITKLDFPGGDYHHVPTQTLFASGGSRGDLVTVGADHCLYVTQNHTRYGDGTTTAEQSIVRICGGFDTPPQSTPPQPTPTGVALGDGFTSGEGAGDYVPASDSAKPHNACHRSTAAYPWGPVTPPSTVITMAAHPAAAAASIADVALVACSRATVTGLAFPDAAGNLTPQGSPEPAQLDSLQPDTAQVMLTIGAADVDLDRLVAQCLRLGGPAWHSPSHPSSGSRWSRSEAVTAVAPAGRGATTGHRDGRSGPGGHGAPGNSGGPGTYGGPDPDDHAISCAQDRRVGHQVDEALERLGGDRDSEADRDDHDRGDRAGRGGSLDRLLAEIRHRSPHATIVVAGYPLLFGAAAPGPWASSLESRDGGHGTPPQDCQVGSLRRADGRRVAAFVSRTDSRWLDEVVLRLDGVIRAATRRAGSGVEYADVVGSFRGHGRCGARTSWITAVTGTVGEHGRGVRLSPESLHPTMTGQQKGYLPVVTRVLAV